MIRFSVVIPAYNEQDFLPRMLDSIDVARDQYEGDAAAIEVIVADNMSTDTTADVASSRGCKVVRVEQRSIAAARNGGAAIARGDIICFVDADLELHPQTFNAVDTAMLTGNIAGGATGWTMERYSMGIRVTELMMRCMTRLAGVDAGLIFCDAQLFKQVGGYNESRQYAEDVVFFRAMKKLGKQQGKITLLSTDTSAIVSARKFDTHGDWHMFRMLLWIPFRYGSYKNLVQAYWYDDKERF